MTALKKAEQTLILCHTLDEVLPCRCLRHTDGLKCGSGKFRNAITRANIRSVELSRPKEEVASFDNFCQCAEHFHR